MSVFWTEFGDALIGLVGVVLGGLIVVLREWLSTKGEHKRQASYSAIRLVCILHEYADKCVDVVQDDGTSHGQPAGRTDDGEEYYVAQVRQPAPPEYPDDIAWRSLPEGLMHQVLGLPNKARTTDRYIDSQSEYAATPPDYSEFFEARQEGYAKLGYDALCLAEQLSERYRIKAVHKANLGSEWDPKAFMAEKIKFFEEQRAEMRRRFEQSAGDLQPILGSHNDE